MIKSFETIEVENETLLLLPEKAIYWPKKSLLLIADLHLGKTSHFRSNGIAVPTNSSSKNWELLNHLFKLHNPKRVCFLGDLFHSTYNKEWDVFGELIANYPEIVFELVLGNHDILPVESYKSQGFKVFTNLLEKPFILTHEPLEEPHEYYNLAGHIHPGVKLKGKGKQRQRLACFYFSKGSGLLPAFGSFTGLANISVNKQDRVFAVTGSEVIPIQ